MKPLIRTILAIILLANLLLIGGCLNEKIDPSDVIVTEDHNLTNFSSISIANGFTLLLTESDTESVQVSAPDNIIDRIEVRSSRELIKFNLEKGINVQGSSNVTIKVSGPDVRSISASGGSTIESLNQIIESELSMELSGGSNVNFDVDIAYLNFDVSGGSIIDLKGSSQDLTISASGGSHFGSYEMVTENADLELSGGSEIYFTLNRELNIEASGASAIFYKGTGTIKNISVSGNSTVTYVD